MTNFKNATKGFIAVCIGLVIVDLILKYYFFHNFKSGTYQQILGGVVTLGNVPTKPLPFGSGFNTTFLPIARIVFQVFFVLLFLRIQRLEISKRFKHSSALIVFGWIGNSLDRFVLTGGKSNLVHLDYFAIDGLGQFTNISSLMVLVGSILFVVAVILNFKEFSLIFKREPNVE